MGLRRLRVAPIALSMNCWTTSWSCWWSESHTVERPIGGCDRWWPISPRRVRRDTDALRNRALSAHYRQPGGSTWSSSNQGCAGTLRGVHTGRAAPRRTAAPRRPAADPRQCRHAGLGIRRPGTPGRDLPPASGAGQHTHRRLPEARSGRMGRLGRRGGEERGPPSPGPAPGRRRAGRPSAEGAHPRGRHAQGHRAADAPGRPIRMELTPGIPPRRHHKQARP